MSNVISSRNGTNSLFLSMPVLFKSLLNSYTWLFADHGWFRYPIGHVRRYAQRVIHVAERLVQGNAVRFAECISVIAIRQETAVSQNGTSIRTLIQNVSTSRSLVLPLLFIFLLLFFMGCRVKVTTAEFSVYVSTGHSIHRGSTKNACLSIRGAKMFDTVRGSHPRWREIIWNSLFVH